MATLLTSTTNTNSVKIESAEEAKAIQQMLGGYGIKVKVQSEGKARLLA